jgi:hypothetical protein
MILGELGPFLIRTAKDEGLGLAGRGRLAIRGTAGRRTVSDAIANARRRKPATMHAESAEGHETRFHHLFQHAPPGKD